MSDGVERALDQLVASLAGRRNIDHVLLAVEKGDGSFRWGGARGQARPGGPPMGPDTPYFIASIDKLYVAALTLRLVEAGLVSLEGRLVDYLTGDLVEGLHLLDGVDYTPDITVRNLLTHTSGLPDWLEDRPKGGRAYIEILLDEGDRGWSLPEAVKRSTTITPHFPPQDLESAKPRIRYSSTNFEMLTLIIEAVVGAPVQSVLRQQVFSPLGLSATRVLDTNVGTPDDGATLWMGDRPLDVPLALASMSAIYSTTADTITFLRSLVEGRFFERSETFAMMQQRFMRFGLPKSVAAVRAPSWPIEYGLGLKRYKVPRAIPPFRKAPAVIGHSGSTGTWLFYCPELDLYTAGTFDQAAAGAVPFRMLPRLLGLFE